MAYDDLTDFLAAAEHAGELVRVRAEVDPVLEIGEITSRVCRQPGGGPAVLFENVRGRSMPVVTNLLGGERRLSHALRCNSLAEVEARIEQLLRPELAEGWLGSLKLLPHLAQLTRLPPKAVKSGRSQQVVRMGRDIDLRELPFLQCFPKERAASVTGGQLVSQHPETGERHVAACLLSVQGQDSLGIHWNPQDTAVAHFKGYRADRRQMPLAVVLGGDPALSFLASLPLPGQADAYLLAGFLREKNVELVKARTLDLSVPACADVVLEGLVDTEVPFSPADTLALPSGFYSLPGDVPVLNVTAVTHRSNPVVPVLVPGMPPTEQTWWDRGAERLLRPIVRLFVPEIVDLSRPAVGAGRNYLFVSIRKEYPQQARKVMNALWGLRGYATQKIVVVVDDDVDVRDEAAVWFHAGANVHPGRDVVFCEGPTHADDHAAPATGVGHKMGLDATRKGPAEGHPREWPDPLAMSRQMRELVDGRWTEYGVGG
jgi:4-hydroxy-3-polyprenylbenzoate decarboxylase